MAIQNRRGRYTDFDPSKMKAGEWAIVQSGDSTQDGASVYIAFAAGNVKRMATSEEMNNANLESKGYAQDSQLFKEEASKLYAETSKKANEVKQQKQDIDQIFVMINEQFNSLKGEKGDKGDKGDQGIQGIQGVKGDKGDTGATGPQGPKGDQGIQGIQGVKGDKGDTGLTGAKGDKGDKGDTGETGAKGDKGDAFTYADFTEQQLLALKGEKGDRGDGAVPIDSTLTKSNEAADAKTTGDKLKQISDDKLNKSGWTADVFLGTDAEGNICEKDVVMGHDGKSAYDLAVENGFAGTLEEWLESLRGSDGEKGEAFTYADFTSDQLALLKGTKGDKGDQGIQGIQGVKGDKGDTGAKGDKGDRGDAFTYSDFTQEQLLALKGEKGDRGDKGDQGIQGIKGDKGDKGNAFTYSDFTSSQLAALKGAKGDKGDRGDAFTYSDFTPQQLALLKGEKGERGEKGEQGEGAEVDATLTGEGKSADAKVTGDKINDLVRKVSAIEQQIQVDYAEIAALIGEDTSEVGL